MIFTIIQFIRNQILKNLNNRNLKKYDHKINTNMKSIQKELMLLNMTEVLYRTPLRLLKLASVFLTKLVGDKNKRKTINIQKQTNTLMSPVETIPLVLKAEIFSKLTSNNTDLDRNDVKNLKTVSKDFYQSFRLTLTPTITNLNLIDSYLKFQIEDNLNQINSNLTLKFLSFCLKSMPFLYIIFCYIIIPKVILLPFRKFKITLEDLVKLVDLSLNGEYNDVEATQMSTLTDSIKELYKLLIQYYCVFHPLFVISGSKFLYEYLITKISDQMRLTKQDIAQSLDRNISTLFARREKSNPHVQLSKETAHLLQEFESLLPENTSSHIDENYYPRYTLKN